jgi:Helix-turn-helix domain
VTDLMLAIPPELVDAIAERVAEILAGRREAVGSPTSGGRGPARHDQAGLAISDQRGTDAEAAGLLTADEVAGILRVSRRYVWRLSREGKLPRVSLPASESERGDRAGTDRAVRFRRVDVDAFIAARADQGPRARSAAKVKKAPRRRRATPRSAAVGRRFSGAELGDSAPERDG